MTSSTTTATKRTVKGNKKGTNVNVCDKGVDKGDMNVVDKGVDKSVDKRVDKGVDKSVDKRVDKSVDKRVDKGDMKGDKKKKTARGVNKKVSDVLNYDNLVTFELTGIQKELVMKFIHFIPSSHHPLLFSVISDDIHFIHFHIFAVYFFAHSNIFYFGDFILLFSLFKHLPFHLLLSSLFTKPHSFSFYF